jgi:hypothetical protein
MPRSVLPLAGLLLLGVVAGSPAADRSPVQALLDHAILEPGQPLAETQDYLESRIPRLPELSTRTTWEWEAERVRRAVLDRVVFRGAARRWRDAEVRTEWQETIPGGPGYRIRKLRYEALPGLWIPALLYEPEQLSGKVPVVLNVNGHDGKGKAALYKQIRCINQAKRGMLALNVEWLGMGQLRGDTYAHTRMNQIDLCGTSGLAPYYLSMKRGLDVLLALEHADPQRVAVTGLSGGGWQTIFISALDTRVTLSDPVAGYSSFFTRVRHFKDLGDSEQTPCDLATVADYTHLTALRAPRPTLLTYNDKDNCCFEAGYALPPLVEAAGPLFKMYGKPEALRTHINSDPGTHNYEKDNRQALYRMLGDFFYPGDSSYSAEEIPSDKEVKTAEELAVELPKDNASFHSLAAELSKKLPAAADAPTEAAAAAKWRQGRRQALREVVRAHDYAAKATKAGTEEKDGIQATYWRLRLQQRGGTAAWTVPVVELVRGEAKGTTLLVADAGRRGAAGPVEKLLDAGQCVLALDPWYFGESKVEPKDWLWALLVSSVGDRPLGLQASQVAAAARWARDEAGGGPVTLAAVGPRSSTFALVAAALEEKAVGRVELQGALGSLRDVIEQNRPVDQVPELLCFGLLEQFDIKQLTALVAPRPAVFAESGSGQGKNGED